MEFTDIPLEDFGYQKYTFPCNLLVREETTTDLPVKVAILHDMVQLREPDSGKILEEWPFHKIRTWTINTRFFFPSELVLDLSPYSPDPLTLASDQVLAITASIRMSIAKRVKEINEGLPEKKLELVYQAIQKYYRNSEKRVILEISKIGIRIVEEKSEKQILSLFSTPEVMVQRSLGDIKNVSLLAEDKVVIQYGEESQTVVVKDPQAILDCFKKVANENRKRKSSTSEDSEVQL